MANKHRMRVKIDKEKMIERFHRNGYSIRKLAPQIGYNECTIRRYLKEGSMPYDIFAKLDRVLDGNNGWTNWDLIMPAVHQLFPDMTSTEFARLINAAMWGDDQFVCDYCAFRKDCGKRPDDACEDIVFEWLAKKVPVDEIPL